jgi:hypothetical protein
MTLTPEWIFILSKMLAFASNHCHDATHEEVVPILWEMFFQFLYQSTTKADLFSPWKQQLQLSCDNTTTLGMCNATIDLSDYFCKQVQKNITGS